ncbi:glycosyltransferase [Virgisporangium aurantiacum]|uniref:Glycosyl transferase family 1 n=1 Tax=Virgisporangium aurantiacum TaxID=175570 RepID=A0A8J3Z723_9ACTN|nr:glycosyltransferase [Virgisporangium aurantiacum]GIJ57577.1 glycosyl transferase family 1 [Virgisporangium aurantiacum]
MDIEFGLLSTHPPTRCGLATFNAALAAELTSAGSGGVVRVIPTGDDRRAAAGVVHSWSEGDVAGWRAGADALNAFDVAVVQHEYGIYPGRDGADVVHLLRRLTVPSIVVLHTVLAQPTPNQKLVLEQVVAAAGAVVTMTGSGRDRLLLGYAVDPGKVSVIPHGVADHSGAPARARRSNLLTWGLLGPGKGIEWALRAMARLRDLDPAPTYTVAGQTHPKVVEREGEAYRERLERLGAMLGISDAVTYLAGYQDAATLHALIGSADVVVLPYDSREQVTSGVLIEAVAAGIPVVATAFPHAVELVTDGRGAIVPHQDSAALAAAIRQVLTRPGLPASAPSAEPVASTLHWPVVAGRYAALARRLIQAGSSTVRAASA